MERAFGAMFPTRQPAGSHRDGRVADPSVLSVLSVSNPG
jgi:hypothetical protein